MTQALEAARTTPPDLSDESKYVRIAAVPIFDENCRYKRVTKEDGTTEVIKQCVDIDKLQQICKNSHDRELEGNYGLLFLGHTEEDKPEHEQPIHLGYIGNYRMGVLREQDNKPVILVDYYIKKKYGQDILDEYPRRSAEIVAKMTDMGFVDSVALLKRTPYRSLGLVTHSYQDSEKYSFNRCDHDLADVWDEIDVDLNAFDPSKHPRHKKGDEHGGEFESKKGSGKSSKGSKEGKPSGQPKPKSDSVFGKSSGSFQFSDFSRDDRYHEDTSISDDTIERIFRKNISHQDLLTLVGVPDGFSVRLHDNNDDEDEGTELDTSVKKDGFELSCNLSENPGDDKPTLRITGFKSTNPNVDSQRLFARQLEQAIKIGNIGEISFDSEYNDESIVPTLIDMGYTKEGRHTLSFDTAEGSKSRKKFDEYLNDYKESRDNYNLKSCECGGSCNSCKNNLDNSGIGIDIDRDTAINSDMSENFDMTDEDYEKIVSGVSDRVFSKMKEFYIEIGKSKSQKTEQNVFENSGNTPASSYNDSVANSQEQETKKESESPEEIKPQTEIIDKHAVDGLAQSKLNRELGDSSAATSPHMQQSGLVAGDGREHNAMAGNASVATATNIAPMVSQESMKEKDKNKMAVNDNLSEVETYRLKYEEVTKEHTKSLMAQLDLSKELDQTKIKLKGVETKLAEEIDRNRLMNREVILTNLHEVDKYQFDLDKFKLKVRGKTDEDFEDLVATIKENFSRSTVGVDIEDIDKFIDTGANGNPDRSPAGSRSQTPDKRIPGPHIFDNGSEDEEMDIVRYAKTKNIKVNKDNMDEVVRQYLEDKKASKSRRA